MAGGAWGEGFGAFEDEAMEGSGYTGGFRAGERGYGEHAGESEASYAGDVERAEG